MDSTAKAKTRSLQLVLDPVAREVEFLFRLTEGKIGSPQLPNLVGAASSVRDAIYGLKNVLDREVAQSQDEHLKLQLSAASERTFRSSNRLVESAHSLKKSPSSHHAKALFRGSVEGIKAGVVEIFSCWDDAAVRRITSVGQLSMDKLEIMSGSQSMRSLVLCFRGYADVMKLLLGLVDQRQKELVHQKEKARLFESLGRMKELLPSFSSAMQTYVKTQSVHSEKQKDSIHQKLSDSLEALMHCVDSKWSRSYPSMAGNLERLQEKLTGEDQKGYSIGPELDQHINAVIKNSRAVASISTDEYKKAILKDCEEVLDLRNELDSHADAVAAAPSSTRAKRAFDRCTQRLCEKLNELDWWVKDSVVHQVADAFMETSGPLNHLVQTAAGSEKRQRSPRENSTPYGTGREGAGSSVRPSRLARSNDDTDLGKDRGMGYHSQTTPTPPPPPPLQEGGGSSGDSGGLKKQVQVFRRHSQRLSEVASFAAQRTKNTRQLKEIQELASKVDKLTTQVADKAMEVSSNPGPRNRRELDALRQEWTANTHKLKRVIDDIVDPEDFIVLSETAIQQDMSKCRGAIKHKNWPFLHDLALKIAAKARRAHEVGENALAKATDHTYKVSLLEALAQLDKAIPRVVSSCKRLIGNPENSENEQSFINSLKEVLQCLRHIQTILGTAVEVTSNVDEDDLLPAQTSTPLHASAPPPKRSTFQERWTNRRRSAHNASESDSPRENSSWRSPSYQRGSPGFQDGNSSSWQSREDSGLKAAGEEELSPRSHSNTSSATQTPRSPTKDQGSQVDHRYVNYSVNATHGSTFMNSPPSLDSSTEHTPRSPAATTITSTPPTSPQGHATVARNPLYTKRISAPMPPTAPPPPLSQTLYEDEDDIDVFDPEEKETPLQSSVDLTMQTYVSPLQKLVSATKRRNEGEMADYSSNLEARAIRLGELAETAASTLNDDPELAKVIRGKSQEVSMLTPTLIKQARAAVRTKTDHGRPWEDFRTTSQKWAGHLRDLIEATQEANLPWSQSAKALVVAAENGESLEDQMEHINTQTDRMADIATMTIKAAEIDDAIGGEDKEGGGDPEMEEQVEMVKTKINEIKKLTPQLLEAADMASRQSVGSAASEHLHLVSQEWATKAKVLMKGVDDITLGMGGAADTLILAAQSGDAGLLQDQATSIKTLANSLQVMAKDAMEGCNSTDKVKVVKVVAKEIAKLSARLVDCATEMSKAFQMEEGEEPPLAVREEAELLRREWSSQVLLLTAHLDHMTAETAAPLNRLMELALAANRTSGLAKQHLMGKFEAKSFNLLEQLLTVESLFDEAAEGAGKDHRKPPEVPLSASKAAIGFLRNLTPHAIGAVRYLATDAGSAMLEHFNHLHRQWSTKAQFLLGSLHKVKSADMTPTIEFFLRLLHDSGPVSPPPMPEAEVSDLSDLSNQSSRADLSSPLLRSYSSEHITTPTTRFDFEGLEVHAPSTPSMDTRPKKKKKPYIPSLAEMGLRHVQPLTKHKKKMAAAPVAWAAADSGDEAPSFDSVTAAAMSLRELTDEFLEESNPLISVGKAMSEQMVQMADFARGRGDLQGKADMINTAKAVAANGNSIFKLAQSICRQCRDQKTRNNLQCCAEAIPTLSTQLTMLASVRSSTGNINYAGDLMLIKNAQNLMKAVIKTVRAAEAACMKNFSPREDAAGEDGEDAVGPDIAVLAMSWKRKLYHHRAKETVTAPQGARGLRVINKIRSTPSAADIIVPSDEYLKTPRKPN